MSELQSRAGFDQREREFVRSALRRYMQEHGIGTPALQYRIIEADQPRRREIPLSTLQRFITGSHHTQDHHVALCHAFVRELPYYGEGRDVAQLGDALASFFPLRWPEPKSPSSAKGPERFCRRYRGSAPTEVLPGQMRLYHMDELHPEMAVFVIPYSELIFEREGNASYLRALETITNPSLDHSASQAQTRATYTYEGVLAPFGRMLRLMLRNTLTRQPRLYELYETDSGNLRGQSNEPSFASGENQGAIDEVECMLSPIAGEPEQ
jgi:hypothetical protein